MTINQRLFELLAEKHCKQNELARAIGISERNVSTWKERGTDPPAYLIIPIADFFGVSVEYLLSGDERKRGCDNLSGDHSLILQAAHNSGTIMAHNDDGARLASEGEIELLRIYGLLDPKERHRLLGVAFEMEEKKSKEGNDV